MFPSRLQFKIGVQPLRVGVQPLRVGVQPLRVGVHPLEVPARTRGVQPLIVIFDVTRIRGVHSVIVDFDLAWAAVRTADDVLLSVGVQPTRVDRGPMVGVHPARVAFVRARPIGGVN